MEELTEYSIKIIEKLNEEKEKREDNIISLCMCSFTNICFFIMTYIILKDLGLNIENFKIEDLDNILFDRALIGFIAFDIFSFYGIIDAINNIENSNKKIKRLERTIKN